VVPTPIRDGIDEPYKANGTRTNLCMPDRLRICAQVAILDRQMSVCLSETRRMAFWERPTPALADRSVLR